MIPPLPSPNYRYIPSFPGYAISDEGVLISCHRTNAGYDPNWKRRQTNIIRGRSGAYEQVGLSRNGLATVVGVHRLVLLAFRGPCPKGCESRHLNGQSLDNRFENLRWGTRKENSDDKRRHDTMTTGAKNGQAKLTTRQVEAIRTDRPTTTIERLAVRFHVSRSQIKRIVSGRSWR